MGANEQRGSPGQAAPAESVYDRNAPYAPTPDNRPVPLERGRLPLTQDRGWQMSFGERAALAGVLSQLAPRLAIEIGAAEGGSLECIAAYSAEVHSIDVTHDAITRALPANVVCHTGASSELLGPLLAYFTEAGRLLDFVLVDGDHSFEGVRGDLVSLLASPATQRSVILVHDTMNAEVRAGIESVRLEDHPNVVYYELEFVPGYVYRSGECRGSVWGGLGLVLTDTDRSPTYPLGPRQSRYLELFEVVQRVRADFPFEP